MTFAFAMAARTLYQEARSEPIDGQRAVAHVIWNRLRSGRWGTTLASVCHWPEKFPSERFAFSGWNAHDPNLIPTLELADTDKTLIILGAVLQAAETAPDPTRTALCYYNPKIAPTPYWAQPGRLLFVGAFGNQRFFADNEQTGVRA